MIGVSAVQCSAVYRRSSGYSRRQHTTLSQLFSFSKTIGRTSIRLQIMKLSNSKSKTRGRTYGGMDRILQIVQRWHLSATVVIMMLWKTGKSYLCELKQIHDLAHVWAGQWPTVNGSIKCKLSLKPKYLQINQKPIPSLVNFVKKSWTLYYIISTFKTDII